MGGGDGDGRWGEMVMEDEEEMVMEDEGEMVMEDEGEMEKRGLVSIPFSLSYTSCI